MEKTERISERGLNQIEKYVSGGASVSSPVAMTLLRHIRAVVKAGQVLADRLNPASTVTFANRMKGAGAAVAEWDALVNSQDESGG